MKKSEEVKTINCKVQDVTPEPSYIDCKVSYEKPEPIYVDVIIK